MVAVLLSCVLVNAQIVDSGSCGENLTWTLSEQEELTIMGVGEMYNYLSAKETPWYDKRGSINRIFIEEGVTSIGDNAFAHCYLLRSITIPESLTTIGTDAFKDITGILSVFNYSNFKELGIFDNILNMNEYVNIDNFLFYTTEEGTHHLKGYIGRNSDIIFPNDYNGDSYQVDGHIFQHPDCVVSVLITEGVENIDALTFDGCSNLTTIVVRGDNTKYDSRENCNAVIETGSNTLILGCSTTFIPSSVTCIASNAFCGCRNLTSILIPKTITKIFSGALFFGCNNLTSVVVEEGNSKYDSRNNCNAIIETSSNTLIAGCSTTIIPEDIESIGTYAFFGRRNLTSIEIPKSVTVLGWWSFAFCDNLTSIVIPSSVTSLRSSIFWNCCRLTSITCNMGSPYPIDYYAFAGVDKSIPVYVPLGSLEAYRSAKYWSEFTNILPLANEYTLSISSAGYATMFLDYAVVIPEGAEAYIATSVEGNRLKMTQATGVLPANTGVIVRAKAGSYTFVESDETPAEVEGNLLVGTTTNEYITTQSGYKYYVLAQKDGVVGMYRPKLTDGQFLNNANKAYLALDMGKLGIFDDETNTEEEGGQLSNRLRFDFSGTTSIQNSETINQNSQFIYDLHGRRITDTEGLKGIYIVNGRKVVI